MARTPIRPSRISTHADKSLKVESLPPRQNPARDTGPTARVRKLVLERDGYACVCCGVSILGRRASLQHRKRRSQGGGNDPANLLTVLGDGTTGCHARIDSRADPRDEANGYTVRSWDDPALIPVTVVRPGGAGVSVFLTAGGWYAPGSPAGEAPWRRS
jgi:hypothetical protein